MMELFFLIYNTLGMKTKEQLIYDLIFSEDSEFRIDIAEYIENIYKYDKFIDEIKEVLKKSKVSIIREKVDLDSKSAIWNLKVKK
jgi:hypothetical protein